MVRNLFSIAVAAVGVFCSGGGALADTNLVSNGDFSANTAGFATTWSPINSQRTGSANADYPSAANIGLSGNDGTITQVIHLLRGTYSISFDYDVKSATAASLIYNLMQGPTLIANSPVFGRSATTNYTNYTSGPVSIATEADYTLKFAGRAYVDNVSVAAVPGPIAGTGAPILLGLAGIAAYRRRKSVSG